MTDCLSLGDNQALKTFYEKMKNEKMMQKPKFEHPVILRGNLLLHAHVLRLSHLLTPVITSDCKWSFQFALGISAMLLINSK